MNFPSYLTEAQRLLEISGASCPPVRLADVLGKCRDIKVSFEDIEGDGYLVDLGVLGSQVMLRKGASAVRQRFTLAHEIGHWILNNQKGSQVKQSDSLTVEEWCNEFAGELLMPSEWVRKHVLDITISDFWKIQDLPSTFYVSAEAFYRKVSGVTPVSIFLVNESAEGAKNISQLKSEECPASLVPYIKQLGSVIAQNRSKGSIKVADYVFCFYMLMRSRARSKDYVVFLVPSQDGLTINCSRRSGLRG